MSGSAPGPSRAEEMKHEFDAGFARAAGSTDTDLIDLLELRVGERHVEIAVADIAGVVARPVLVRLPRQVRALRGIASVGDVLIAAYDLGVLLGGEPSEPGWLLTAAVEPGVGLILDQVVAHRRVPRQGTRDLPTLSLPDLVGTIRSIAAQSNRRQT